MKTKQIRKTATVLLTSLFVVAMSLVSVAAQTGSTPATAPPVLTPEEKKLVSAFDSHVKDYIEQRNLAAKKVPAISKEATPQEIQKYQDAFVAQLRGMRAGTQRGYMFTQAMSEYVRTLVKTEFPPRDKAEIKQTILEADTKGVPLKINYPFPETKELTQIPPTLLLKLPQLPKQVKYRFVGRHLLLVDTDNGIIVDYMLNALQ